MTLMQVDEHGQCGQWETSFEGLGNVSYTFQCVLTFENVLVAKVLH